MYLLDTNVISELRKRKPHGAVVTWFRSVSEKALHLGAPTIGEIQRGIEITDERDNERAIWLSAWLDEISKTYNVLPMDGEAFRLYAKLMHGRSDTLSEDGMIAAIAKSNGLTIVTRNIRDFVSFGVDTFNPFTAVQP